MYLAIIVGLLTTMVIAISAAHRLRQTRMVILPLNEWIDRHLVVIAGVGYIGAVCISNL